ncbi:hypothetical protein I5677_06290 [Mobilitalea sibirica]|uniref:DUF1700 domain-containing protein n=1 Tax=Mobilitalea sibirica TaxID=1462919 RepID=A0A8J7H262_9FIRM|nr:hypothetical protein [Mobilitalea sibirica]MBH1940500.1 hypothetical protein [Mobilitalea sibirica]
MSKREFLEILRQSLAGETEPEIIEQHIQYYDQYIGSNSTKQQEEILEELGDPRLIARTIIESERIAKQKSNYMGSQEYSDYQYYNQDNAQNSNKHTKKRNGIFFTNTRWYHRIVMLLIFIIVLASLFTIGRILIGFLFSFGMPLLFILMIYLLFRRR